MIELLEDSPSEFEEAVTATIMARVQGHLHEKQESGDDAEYDAFYQKTLKKFGVEEADELDDDKKKEFFQYIEDNWESDEEAKTPEKGDD